MIGVNPPGHFLWDAQTTDAQLQRYSRLYAQSDASRDGTTGDLAASMRYTAKHMPDRWLGLPIREGNVRIASFFGLMESTSKASPFAAPVILDAWRSAANGDASGFWLSSLIGELMFPKMQVWGEYAAIGSADDQAARDYFASGRHERGSAIGDPRERLRLGRRHAGRCVAGQPRRRAVQPHADVERRDPPDRRHAGRLDAARERDQGDPPLPAERPPGRALRARALGLVLERAARSGQPADRHLLRHRQDRRLAVQERQVDFTPAVSFAMVAKIVAGSMLGLAIVAVVSLLWMARRAHKRVAFGRARSAVMRSLYPVVLGLGGWCAGALLVMVTTAAVPLDGDLLAVLAAGVPAGLGVYYAWLGRDASAASRTAGLGPGDGCGARRRLAGVPRSRGGPGTHHHDRGRGPRRQPHPRRLRHHAGAVGARPPRGRQPDAGLDGRSGRIGGVRREDNMKAIVQDARPPPMPPSRWSSSSSSPQTRHPPALSSAGGCLLPSCGAAASDATGDPLLDPPVERGERERRKGPVRPSPQPPRARPLRTGSARRSCLRTGPAMQRDILDLPPVLDVVGGDLPDPSGRSFMK